MKGVIWKNHFFISICLVALFVNLLELVLLHFKYTLFTGGFLQPYSFQSVGERTTFGLLSLFYDLVFFGSLATVWHLLTKKFKRQALLSSVYFVTVFIVITGALITAKYQILSYFSDTVNLLLLKNIAGGSIQGALAYASNEIIIALLGFAVVIACCYIVIRLLSNSTLIKEYPQKGYLYINKSFIWLLLVTVPVTYFCTHDEQLRYGLKKKTSFAVFNKLFDTATDFDRDGHGEFSYPADPAPFNAKIYPNALDIPENGLDEDGLLGDFIYSENKVDSFDSIPNRSGKHIVFIVLESARADLLGKRVNNKPVAPFIDKLADNGTAIDYTYSHTGYTVSSLKAIFNRSLVAGDKSQTGLIDFLHLSGYQFSFFSGQDESFGGIAQQTGMVRYPSHLFDAQAAINDRVYGSTNPGSLRLSEERVIEAFLTHANSIDFEQPQFIYLNFQAAHFPYAHPKMKKIITEDFIPRSKINISNKEWLNKTYWNAIASADWAVEQVYNFLNEKGLYDNTTFVIVSDHGESLYEDGFLGHGHKNNDAQTKIPFIINDKNINIDRAIGQTEIAEITVRSALGLENTWLEQTKPVFQYIGSLSSPTQITHIHQKGIRTTFDFRTQQVFFSEQNKWVHYKQALTESGLEQRVSELIKQWESLRWQTHAAKIQP